jgi:hypothetical protein
MSRGEHLEASFQVLKLIKSFSRAYVVTNILLFLDFANNFRLKCKIG